ncbi:ABC transporter substrate-binding protein [Alkalilimnicola ehrlichii]|nr:ABC transporter substrate-binding protein [Alkalilimnicola ehrlichii]
MTKLRAILVFIYCSVFAALPVQAGLSDNEVRIAVMTDMHGVYSDLAGQGSVVAAQMAIEDHGGRVMRRPVRLLTVDHRHDPEYAVTEAERLIKEEGVDAIVDLMGSEVATAVQQLAAEHGIVTLVSGAVTPLITQDFCSPTGVHWAGDSFGFSTAVSTMLVQRFGKGVTVFYVTVDYPQAVEMERATASVTRRLGGEVIGSVRHPFRGADFSRQLLEAQASGADGIALLNAGEDMYLSIRQAYELGITHEGQVLLPGLMFITDVRALGLYVTRGLMLASTFYWDQDDDSRAWADRFMRRHGTRPTAVHAAAYSAVAHYLKAVEAAGTDDGPRVIEAIRELPVTDFYGRGGRVREDGRLLLDMNMLEVKRPSESREAWDYYHVLGTIPGEKAFLPLELSRCPHVN